MSLRTLLILSLTSALAAPGALLAQTPPTLEPPAAGEPAPPPVSKPVEKTDQKKADGPAETIGGAVGGVLGSAAGAAGGPVGSAAAGLVGKTVGRNTASFMKRMFGGKKDRDEPQLLQVAAPAAPAADTNAVETAVAVPEVSPPPLPVEAGPPVAPLSPPAPAIAVAPPEAAAPEPSTQPVAVTEIHLEPEP